MLAQYMLKYTHTYIYTQRKGDKENKQINTTCTRKFVPLFVRSRNCVLFHIQLLYINYFSVCVCSKVDDRKQFRFLFKNKIIQEFINFI